MVNPLGGHPRLSFACHLCDSVCKSGRGLTLHQQAFHREFTPASEDDPDNHKFTTQSHPLLNGAIHSNYQKPG
jgi:hypothetical protein